MEIRKARTRLFFPENAGGSQAVGMTFVSPTVAVDRIGETMPTRPLSQWEEG
jgi:hypothetical protein